MTRDELLILVRSIDAEITEDEIVSELLDQLEEALPHGDVCDLIFQDMRNLTPEQIVDEAMRREMEYRRTKMKD